MKTTTFYPQSNGGSLERTHATVKDLIRTAMSNNRLEWDNTLKFICMAYNTMVHEGTGFSPFHLVFGRDANLPSLLATTPSLKYPELVRLCKERHEKYIRKTHETIQRSKERYKRIQDARIVILQKVFEVGDLVLIENVQAGKLSADGIGPGVIVKVEGNNNYEIPLDNKPQRIHSNRLKLYYH